MHYILDDPLSIRSRMPTCRNLALGHAWLAWQKLTWFVKNSSLWHPLVGSLCARGGILLGIASYLGVVVFLWFLLSICSTHDCKMCFRSQRVMATWYDGPEWAEDRCRVADFHQLGSLRSDSFSTQWFTSLVTLAVCCGRVHVLSRSAFRNSDFFLCGFMLVNEASQPSHMKIIGGLWNIVVLISMGKNWKLWRSVHGICYEWSEDLALTLSEGTRKSLCDKTLKLLK